MTLGQKILAKPAPATSLSGNLPAGLLQRQCACSGAPGPSGECAECQKKKLLRQTQNPASGNRHGTSAPPIVHEVLLSPGQPLDSATRTMMEPRFGHDFSKVRVHTGHQAAESARAVHAHAYTVGTDVVFNEGKYAPQSEAGQRLLAHEFTHVIQQRDGAGPPQTQLEVGVVDSPAEREAEVAAAVLSSGMRYTPQQRARPGLARQANANECTWGEIRQWAINNVGKPYDGSAPAGLEDAKESIGQACGRNTGSKNCNCTDGSKATKKGDQDAWNNIVNASGGKDLTGGGNFMCVGHENCTFVHTCGDLKTGKPVKRAANLTPSGTVTIKGHTIFFYNDPRNGACPPKPKPRPKQRPKPKKKPQRKPKPKSKGTGPKSDFPSPVTDQRLASEAPYFDVIADSDLEEQLTEPDSEDALGKLDVEDKESEEETLV